MANSYQQAARRRKLIYAGLIVVLFVATIFVRGVVAMPLDQVREKFSPYTIQAKQEKLDLSEMSQGDVELSGSAVRLLLTGSRGFVVCALWISASEKQTRQEWNNLELTVRSITKLQPHFVTPWLFQSWNLAYNVSVEMDRVADKYFYIARGIGLLAEGESVLRNHPDLRYSLAFYYQNKFTVSDQVTTLRCLFNLSCMPKEERDYRTLMKGGQVDMAAFRAFCEKNPSLVRRLREAAIRPGKGPDGNDLPLIYLVQSPKDVVDFLRDNEVLPNRFREDAPKVLEDRLKQFPVLPPAFYRDPTEELNPERPIGDGEASAVRAARAWFRYANEVIPPPNPEPSYSPRNYRDPERKRRMPSRPMLIIFRQGPMRAQSFVAEQVEKDGWFDSQDFWVVDYGRDPNDRWFRDEVRIKPTHNAKEEWDRAYTMWDQHGRANGLLFDQNELYQKYGKRAEVYARRRGFNAESGDMPQPRADEQNDPTIADSIRAIQTLRIYRSNLQNTNFLFFLHQAEFERDEDTIRARKLLARADRLRRQYQERDAIALYEQAFGTQENPGPWMRLLLKKSFNKMNDKLAEKLQEETYEQQIHYLQLFRSINRLELQKATVALLDVLRLASPAALYPQYAALSDLVLRENLWPPLRTEVAPIWPPGPFDGLDPEGNPWIPEYIADRVRTNLGLNRAKPAAKAENKANSTEQ